MTDTLHRPKSGTAVSVRLEGINLSFGKIHVLKGIDLQIEPGEFFAFLGPSGCGKTTLLRLIAGFESAQTGQVFIGDKEVSYLPPWQRNLGMVAVLVVGVCTLLSYLVVEQRKKKLGIGQTN